MIARNPLPTRRANVIQKATVAGQTLYLTTGHFEDGQLGEVFVDVNKAGSAFRTVMSVLAIFASVGLQYGVPLEEYVDALEGVEMVPAGAVEGDTEVTEALSILDWIGRHLRAHYLSPSEESWPGLCQDCGAKQGDFHGPNCPGPQPPSGEKVAGEHRAGTGV